MHIKIKKDPLMAVYHHVSLKPKLCAVRCTESQLCDCAAVHGAKIKLLFKEVTLAVFKYLLFAAASCKYKTCSICSICPWCRDSAVRVLLSMVL